VVLTEDQCKYVWKDVGPVKFPNEMGVKEGDHYKMNPCADKSVPSPNGLTNRERVNLLKLHDTCICRIPEITLPPLDLSPDEYFLGSEVGIIGFPVFERLQRISIQPYALKTILSSRICYPFEIDGKLVGSQRIALGCSVAHGFSGSPVFSTRDGKIIGMIDYVPTSITVEDIKIIKPRLIEGDIRVDYSQGISFAVPSILIQECLDISMKGDWDNPGEQEISR
jgi:hypothetical protein